MLAGTVPDQAQLNHMTARFAPVELKVDISGLSPGDRQALVKLIEAARIYDDIYMRQSWSGNQATYAKLQQDTTPLGKARLHYSGITKAHWSDWDGHGAFVPGVPAKKPLGANFYPEDITREQFETWAKTLSKPERESAEGFFSVIRRNPA